MRVKITGQPGDVEAEVESVDQTTGTDTAQVTAVMPDGMGNLGGSASFTVYMESDAYPLVIPIEALRAVSYTHLDVYKRQAGKSRKRA